MNKKTNAPLDEKTAHRCWAVNSKVDLHHLGNVHPGVCKGLSATELHVETDQPFAVDDELTVSIQRNRNPHLPFKATARVLYSDLMELGHHVLGLSIQEIHV